MYKPINCKKNSVGYAPDPPLSGKGNSFLRSLPTRPHRGSDFAPPPVYIPAYATDIQLSLHVQQASTYIFPFTRCNFQSSTDHSLSNLDVLSNFHNITVKSFTVFRLPTSIICHKFGAFALHRTHLLGDRKKRIGDLAFEAAFVSSDRRCGVREVSNVLRILFAAFLRDEGGPGTGGYTSSGFQYWPVSREDSAGRAAPAADERLIRLGCLA